MSKNVTSIRTCIFCRNKFEKADLTRYCNNADTILEDTSRNLPGRGVYLCGNCKGLYLKSDERGKEKIDKRIYISLHKRKKG